MLIECLDINLSLTTMTTKLSITILVDDVDSWIVDYAQSLNFQLIERGHDSIIVYDNKMIRSGDISFFLGCGKIVPPNILSRNKHNLVVHESLLPKGKGWSPMTWQILEGKNRVPITLFEAAEEVDGGNIYFQDWIKLEGHELVGEIRLLQGNKTIEFSLKYIDKNPKNNGVEQMGKETFYPKRTPKDSEIDPSSSIVDLFNRMRVADNQRYPMFFFHKGSKYFLHIFKDDDYKSNHHKL